MGKKKQPPQTSNEATEAKPDPAAPPPQELAAKAECTPKAKEAGEEEEDSAVVKELKTLDDEYLALERKYQEEEQELRRKYNEQQTPILEKRTKVLEAASTSAANGAIRGFWLQAMKHHPAFEDTVEEWDEPVLEHISDIKSSYLDDCNLHKGFKLSFYFGENPFFENDVLWKEYHAEEKSPYTGEFKATVIKVSDIKWKPGKDVTFEMVKKKTKGAGAKKKAAKAATQVKEPRDSFFRSFFRNLEPGLPIPDDINLEDAKQLCDDSDEDNESEMMSLLMENDYEMGCAVSKQLVPFAVRWYTGEACPEWNCTDDDDDEDEDEDDDTDPEDSDPDEEEDEETFIKGKKPKSKKQPAGGGKEKLPGKEECKQQ